MRLLNVENFSINLFLANHHLNLTMQNRNCLIYWISSIILSSHTVFGTEFTFDLADSVEQCFYEVIKEGVECSLDFQVSVLNPTI